VSLSGGLDSRTVLAAVAQGSQRKSQAYSWGMSDIHDEMAIARQTADRLGVPWQFIPLAPADFISEAGRGVFLTEGLDLAVQSYGLKVYPLIGGQTDALLTGLALDLTLGGSYLASATSADDNARDCGLTWALRKAALFSAEDCLGLVRLNDTPEILEGLRQEAVRIWQTGQNEHPADQCDRFFLRSRVWRYTFQRQAWQRLFVEDLTPTFDNEFIDRLLCIPPAWRADHRFYQSFLERLEPRLMEIPYQRTMLPPAAPLEFWHLGAQLEQRREELCRDIWRATQGAVSIPYRRFFTNYDEWLRCDPDWIAMTDDLLLSPKSVSCERFLNRQSIAGLIADHRSGKAANHQKIIQLMTLELLLRQFFN
jgi:asparagine synthetase B (glutamine-hydrolysing)